MEAMIVDTTSLAVMVQSIGVPHNDGDKVHDISTIVHLMFPYILSAPSFLHHTFHMRHIPGVPRNENLRHPSSKLPASRQSCILPVSSASTLCSSEIKTLCLSCHLRFGCTPRPFSPPFFTALFHRSFSPLFSLSLVSRCACSITVVLRTPS